jgi:hypothetical protein
MDHIVGHIEMESSGKRSGTYTECDYSHEMKRVRRKKGKEKMKNMQSSYILEVFLQST